ncbi:MAG: CBS domain-containing protein [Aquisalimonadaceae bacterium]
METILKVVLVEKAKLLADRGGTLYTVKPDAPAAEAIRTMCEANIGCVLVIDKGKLIGIFSERDVLHRIVDRGIPPDTVPVGDVMTKDIFTVPPTLTVEDALIECTNRRVRHLPVCEQGRLLGLLSIGDLVRFVVEDKDGTISDLIDYIHGPQITV